MAFKIGPIMHIAITTLLEVKVVTVSKPRMLYEGSELFQWIYMNCKIREFYVFSWKMKSSLFQINTETLKNLSNLVPNSYPSPNCNQI